MKTITKQIVGDLDFLYQEILETSKRLTIHGYDAYDGNVEIEFNGCKTLLNAFFKRKNSILNGEFNDFIACAKPIEPTNYNHYEDKILMISDKTKAGLQITLKTYYYSWYFDGRNSNTETEECITSYLIK